MATIWTTYILLVTTIAVAMPQGNDINGTILGDTISHYDAAPGSGNGSFTATIPRQENTLSNADSSRGQITGNTIVNYHAPGSTDSASADQNVLSNVGSASGNISNNRIINYYYGGGNEGSAPNPPTQLQREHIQTYYRNQYSWDPTIDKFLK